MIFEDRCPVALSPPVLMTIVMLALHSADHPGP